MSFQTRKGPSQAMRIKLLRLLPESDYAHRKRELSAYLDQLDQSYSLALLHVVRLPAPDPPLLKQAFVAYAESVELVAEQTRHLLSMRAVHERLSTEAGTTELPLDPLAGAPRLSDDALQQALLGAEYARAYERSERNEELRFVRLRIRFMAWLLQKAFQVDASIGTAWGPVAPAGASSSGSGPDTDVELSVARFEREQYLNPSTGQLFEIPCRLYEKPTT